MALTPLGWGISPWADPRWWAEQQIKVMTATATYVARVAQACTGAAAVAAGEADLPAPERLVTEPVVTEPPVAEPPVPELPVAGWDELSLGSIRARLSRLSEADLAQLLHYEERHGGRPAVVSMLTNRLAKIRLA